MTLEDVNTLMVGIWLLAWMLGYLAATFAGTAVDGRRTWFRRCAARRATKRVAALMATPVDEASHLVTLEVANGIWRNTSRSAVIAPVALAMTPLVVVLVFVSGGAVFGVSGTGQHSDASQRVFLALVPLLPVTGLIAALLTYAMTVSLLPTQLEVWRAARAVIANEQLTDVSWRHQAQERALRLRRLRRAVQKDLGVMASISVGRRMAVDIDGIAVAWSPELSQLGVAVSSPRLEEVRGFVHRWANGDWGPLLAHSKVSEGTGGAADTRRLARGFLPFLAVLLVFSAIAAFASWLGASAELVSALAAFAGLPILSTLVPTARQTLLGDLPWGDTRRAESNKPVQPSAGSAVEVRSTS